jgi:signal transduction histidine kinase
MWKKLLIVSLIFAISVVILIVLSLYSFQRFNGYVQYTDAVDRHHVLLTQLNELKLNLAEMENYQRAFLLFNDSTFLTGYEARKNKIKDVFASVHRLTKNDRGQQKRMRILNMTIKSRMDYLHTGLIVGYPSTDYKQDTAYMDRCKAIIEEMEGAENTALTEQLRSKEFYENTTPQNFRTVFILTMTIFAVSFGLLLQQYRDRLNYQQKLEKNILELNQVNSEWEQIAHAASHDLQEPLRKIRTFSNILRSRHLNKLDEDGQTVVKRIEAASLRAQSLMIDIVNYNMVVAPREEISLANLNEIFDDLMQSMEQTLKSQNAAIYADGLPDMPCYPSQMNLLFRCLIDNSLKFCRDEEPARITISGSVIEKKELPIKQNLSFSQYHKIVFEDNGIGFENQFSDKIFKMFQRLHGQDAPYEGRGIGLAIVKRIMTNHLGFVVARGRPGKGAKFILYFPVR